MTPAGIERDKQIAEMRGDAKLDMECILPISEDCPNMDDTDNCPNECEYNMAPRKPYSTDISCAMELWEEIWDASLMLTLKASFCGTVICEIFRATGDGDELIHTTEGKTASDAISGAWLRWKEGA